MRVVFKAAVLAAMLATTLAATGARAAPPAAPLGAEHAALGRLAGHWSVTQSYWAAPDKPPAVDRGEADFQTVLGGRHLRQDLRIPAPDRPFQGLGYIGYDADAKTFFSTWMDVNFTGLIVARGGYDAAARRYTFTGAAPDGAPLREVMTVQDDDHFTYDYYETHGGREARAVRLEYARVR
jgi:hypothetical protein